MPSNVQIKAKYKTWTSLNKAILYIEEIVIFASLDISFLRWYNAVAGLKMHDWSDLAEMLKQMERKCCV